MKWPWQKKDKEKKIKQDLRSLARQDAETEPQPQAPPATDERPLKPAPSPPQAQASGPGPAETPRSVASRPDGATTPDLGSEPEAAARPEPAAPPGDPGRRLVEHLEMFSGDDLTLYTSRRRRRAIGLKGRPRPARIGAAIATFYGHNLTSHVDRRRRRRLLPALHKRVPLGKRVLGGLAAALKWMFALKVKILIMERYIWAECFGNFIIGAMGFTFFMIITSVFSLGEKIFQKNIPPFTIAKVLVLSAPAFLVLAIPVAVVFSTLMGMGRLNRDNEIVAFTTNGVSIYRVFIPFLAMAIFAAISTWLIYEHVVPPNNQEYKDVLKVFWQAQVVDFIKPGIVIKAPQRKYFYVEEIRKEKLEGEYGTYFKSYMYGLRLYDYYKGTSQQMRNFPRIFKSEKAWVDNQFLVLSDVTLYNIDEIKGDSLVTAKMPEVSIDIGTRVVEYTLKPHPTELTALDLRHRIKQIRERLASATFPSPSLKKEYYRDWTEYYFKYAIPFACIALVLVAVPVSLTGPRDERNLGIIMTFGLVMAYYIIFFVCRTLGSRGVEIAQAVAIQGNTLIERGTNMFPPYVAAWTPCAAFIIASVFLFWRSRK